MDKGVSKERVELINYSTKKIMQNVNTNVVNKRETNFRDVKYI